MLYNIIRKKKFRTKINVISSFFMITIQNILRRILTAIMTLLMKSIKPNKRLNIHQKIRKIKIRVFKGPEYIKKWKVLQGKAVKYSVDRSSLKLVG